MTRRKPPPEPSPGELIELQACDDCRQPLLVRYVLGTDGEARMVLVCEQVGCPSDHRAARLTPGPWRGRLLPPPATP